MQAKYVKNAFRRALLQVGVSLLCLGLLGYIGYHVWQSLTSAVTTATALPVTVEDVLRADGYLFRTEQLLYASGTAGGSVTAVLADGEKARVGGAVARLYDRDAPEVVARLSEIEEQLRLLEKSSSGSLSLKDISRLDESMQTLITDLHGAVIGGDYSSVSAVRKDLITGSNKRELIIGNLTNLEATMADLRAEAAALTGTLGVCRETVTAPTGGYYYAAADGYETLFTPSLLGGLTPGVFRQLISALPASPAANCVGKLVTDYNWSIACLVTAEEAENMTVGDTYTVGFPNNHDVRLSMTLTDKRTDEDKTGTVLVFASDRMPQEFDFIRTQALEIVRTEHTGFRIPGDAIRIVNGQKGVYILDGSTVRFRRISVIAAVDDAVIAAVAPEEKTDVPWLSRNDTVILTGKDLFDGRMLT